MAERDELLLAVGAATNIPASLEVMVSEAEPTLEMVGKYKARVIYQPEESGPDKWRRDLVDNTNTSVSGSIGYHATAALALDAVIAFYNDEIS
jgi:hypothetical protein